MEKKIYNDKKERREVKKGGWKERKWGEEGVREQCFMVNDLMLATWWNEVSSPC